MFAINDGPFAGTSFTFQEAVRSLVGTDQTEKAAILMSALNQVFLKHYDPKEGWAVIIEGSMVGLDMSPLPAESDQVRPVPCAKFDARLISPEGRTLATASSIWTICGPTSWEKGETNARLRLYEASGLQTRFDLPKDVSLETEGALEVGVAAATPASKMGNQASPKGKTSSGDTRKGKSILEFRPYVDPRDEEGAKQADVVDAAGADTVSASDKSEAAVAAVAAEQAVIRTNGEACQAAEEVSSEASKVEAAAEAQPERAVDSVKAKPEAKGRRGQARKRELDRDAPISPELFQRCKTMAKMKFKKVPEMSSTGDALDFLTALGG